MSVVACLHSTDIRRSLEFYTRILGFKVVRGWEVDGDPGVTLLKGHGGRLFLSSHSGDGTTGQPVAVLVREIDKLFATFVARGLQVPDTGGRSPVHEGPIDQSWGSREVYIDDPDGNTLRFVRG